jgi:hypothetical protein
MQVTTDKETALLSSIQIRENGYLVSFFRLANGKWSIKLLKLSNKELKITVVSKRRNILGLAKGLCYAA